MSDLQDNDIQPNASVDAEPDEPNDELDESELENVAGGITWHRLPDEPTPATKWEPPTDW